MAMLRMGKSTIAMATLIDLAPLQFIEAPRKTGASSQC